MGDTALLRQPERAPGQLKPLFVSHCKEQRTEGLALLISFQRISAAGIEEEDQSLRARSGARVRCCRLRDSLRFGIGSCASKRVWIPYLKLNPRDRHAIVRKLIV